MSRSILLEYLCGTNNLFKLILLICGSIVLFTSISFFEMVNEEAVPLSALKNKIAVVYANPTFHDEVVSANACVLHDLGYYVVVYIGNGVHFADMLLPFSQRRKRNSQNFYGRCVSQWVTISDHMKFVPNIDILVFVTYPMLVHGMKPDEHALMMLRYYKDHKQSEFPIVLVTHRSQEMLGLNGELAQIESIVPRSRLTFLFLGEHTENGAKSFLAAQLSGNNNNDKINDNDNKNNNMIKKNDINNKRNSINDAHIKSSHSLGAFIGSVDSFKIEHIYPVMPKDYVVSENMEYYQYTSVLEHCWHIFWNLLTSKSTFMKGQPEAKEKSSLQLDSQASDIYHSYNTISDRDMCSNKKYQPFIGAKSEAAGFVDTVNNHRFLSHSGGAMFSVQGNFGGKHAYRKDPLSVVSCLQRIESALLRASELGRKGSCSSTSSSSGSSGSSSSSSKSLRERNPLSSNINSNRGVFNISLDLIGHLDGDIDVHEDSLQTGKVRFLSDLDSKSYYTAISRTMFMVAGLKDREYLTTRATSSIPAALIAQVPLVMTREYLEIYPCLREQKIHKKIARETECESVEVAFWLEQEEYDLAVSEVKHCSEFLWEKGKTIYQKIIHNNKFLPH